MGELNINVGTIKLKFCTLLKWPDWPTPYSDNLRQICENLICEVKLIWLGMTIAAHAFNLQTDTNTKTYLYVSPTKNDPRTFSSSAGGPKRPPRNGRILPALARNCSCSSPRKLEHSHVICNFLHAGLNCPGWVTVTDWIQGPSKAPTILQTLRTHTHIANAFACLRLWIDSSRCSSPSFISLWKKETTTPHAALSSPSHCRSTNSPI